MPFTTYTEAQRQILTEWRAWPRDIGRIIAGYAAPDDSDKLLFLLLDTCGARINVITCGFWIAWEYRRIYGPCTRALRLRELRRLNFWIGFRDTQFERVVRFDTLLRGLQNENLNRIATNGRGAGWMVNRPAFGQAISDYFRRLLARY